MPGFIDRRSTFWGGDKPSGEHQIEVDSNATLGLNLELVCLFDAPADGYADIADPSRVFVHYGQIDSSDGGFGGQIESTQSGASGDFFSPYIGLSPSEEQTNAYTISAWVNFDGTNPVAGTYGLIAAVLCSDGAGRFPLTSPVGADPSFEARNGTNATNFTAVGGATLQPSALTGWHRLTVVCNATNTTLYVDGGRTFTGTSATTITGFALSTMLGGGPASQPGTHWSWPTADFFFWSRALTTGEVMGHSLAPWTSTMRSRFGVVWEAIPGGTSPPPPPPPPPPGTEPTLSGKGGVTATATALPSFPTATLPGGGFLRADAVARSRGTAVLAGVGVATANPQSSAPHATINVAAGSVTANPGVQRSGSSTIAVAGTAVAANVVARQLAFAVTLGAGNATGSPTWIENSHSAHATINGTAGVSSPATKTLRAASTTIGGRGGVGNDASGMIGPIVGRRTVNGIGFIHASPVVLLKPKVLAGRGTGAMPAFYAIEIETYVPGSTPVNATEAHGTRAHGTLSQSTQGSPELTQIIRASDMGYRTRQSDTGGLVSYPPLLDQAFQINTQLNLDPAQSAAGASWGTLLLVNLPNYWLDQISMKQNCDGRTLTIWQGVKGWDPARQYVTDPPKSSLTPAFVGVGTAWTMDSRELQIPLRDASYFLEPVIPTISIYSGGGRLTGTQTLATKTMPYCRGGSATNPISNVSPVLVDPSASGGVYQYNGGPGLIVTLYEGGFGGTPQALTSGGDYPDLYNMPTATAPGTYRTCNAQGLFILGSNPVGTLTADVVGGFPTIGILQPPNPISLARHILTEDVGLQSTMIDMNSWNAAQQALLGYEAGIYFDGGTTAPSGIAVVSAILSGLGANIIPARNGTLRLLLVRAITNEPAVEVLDDNIVISVTPKPLPSGLYPPRFRTKIGYRHNYTVQTSGLNMTQTSLARQQYLATTDQYAGWSSGDVLRAFRRPNDPGEVATALLKQQDAQTVANDLGAMWGVARKLYAVSVPIGSFDRDVGDVVALKYPIADLRSGPKGRIVGYSLNSTDSAVIYSVLV